MWLSTTSVKHPVAAAVLAAALVVIGVASLMRTQIRQYPDVDQPTVSVQTTYRGAPAEVIDADVTKRLLDGLSGVEGIRQIDATSTDGQSRVNIEFRLDRDLDFATADVVSAVSRVRNDLPQGIDEPQVRRQTSDASPIMWLSLRSDRLDPLELTDVADRQIEERLSVLPGVAEVRISGQRRYAVRIDLDSTRMAAAGVTVGDITARLRQENVEVASGLLESRAREFTLRALSRLEDVDTFDRLVIRRTPAGVVRVGDVADVRLGAEDDRTFLRADGRVGVGVGIVRQSDANTIDVIDRVLAELDDIRSALPPDVELQISSDDSVFIRESIREVAVTIAIAMALVVLVILVFLGSPRLTIVPAVTIPVSIVATGTLLWLAGFSINVLTLLAAVLAIGLVVDDAIVVLENVARRVKELGEPPLLAAARGAGEVGLAVVATTVVLVAVFVPIAFLTGRVGRLFTEFGMMLAVAVIFSSFTALTTGVMLCSKLVRAPSDDPPGRFGRFSRKLRRPFVKTGTLVRDGYARSVDWAIRGRWIVAGLMLLVAAAAAFFFVRLPDELTPTEDQGDFLVFIEGPEGATLDYTRQQVQTVEDVIFDTYGGPDGPFRTMIAIGPDFRRQGATNTAVMIVRLKPYGDRDVTPQQIVGELTPRLRRELPGARAFAVGRPGLGLRTAGQPVQFVVGGPTYDNARDWAQQVVAEARDSGLFSNLRAEWQDSRPQFDISFDRDRMAELGVSAADVGETLQAYFGGLEVTDFFDRGELYEVVLQAPRDLRASPDDLRGLFVRAQNADALVPLESLLTLSERGTVRELRRVDRLPSVLISAGLAGDATLGQALDVLDDAARNLPPDARVRYLGESLELREGGGQLYVTFALALLLVYLALAAQFGSFVHPFTILVSVPLAVTGGLGALWIAGGTLNIYSQIGMILLIGLTTKNGILLVEFANQIRGSGADVHQSAREAARVRLRPILMTAISTILGAVPLAVASGAGAEGRQAIGIVVIGGMLFSTLLTLFGVPAVYTLLAGFTRPAGETARRLDELELNHKNDADDSDTPRPPRPSDTWRDGNETGPLRRWGTLPPPPPPNRLPAHANGRPASGNGRP